MAGVRRHWRQSRLWPQLWTAVRLTAEMLSADEEHEPALPLLEAADHGHGATPVSGPDRPRHEEIRARAQEALDASTQLRIRALTSTLTAAQVIERALVATCADTRPDSTARAVVLRQALGSIEASSASSSAWVVPGAGSAVGACRSAAVDLVGHRSDRGPLRVVVVLGRERQPHRPLTDLSFMRGSSWHGSIHSDDGAVRFPGRFNGDGREGDGWRMAGASSRASWVQAGPVMALGGSPHPHAGIEGGNGCGDVPTGERVEEAPGDGRRGRVDGLQGHHLGRGGHGGSVSVLWVMSR